jgi:MEMO1 family protein
MTDPRVSPPLRRLAFAGSWYDSDPVRLASQVDAWLASVEPSAPPARAIVSPHAGLRFSGAVAARSYRALGDRPREAIVLVGPSHYVSFPGCAMLARGTIASPWAPHPVASDLADALAARAPSLGRSRDEVHAGEHSLELQLPLVARVQPGVPLLLILMGDQTREVAFGLGDALADVLEGQDVALVASSDLSHFHDARTAHEKDRVVLDALDGRSAEQLMRVLEAEPHHACGGGPMVAVMHAASRLGATSGGVLAYADSGEVTGDLRSVVGYVSAAFREPR